MAVIQFPLLYVPNPTLGRPLFNCQIFVGIEDLDPEVVGNQKQLNVIQEDGTVVPVSQPFVTSAGGVPTYNGKTVRLDVDGNYSFKVLDSLGVQKYYVQNVVSGTPITGLDLINDLSQSYDFATVQLMQDSPIVFPLGKRLTTGQGVWTVVVNKGLSIAGGNKASSLNGVFMSDCGAKGNALFRDDSIGVWYVDSGLTVPADDDTAAFSLAITATGGTDSKGTINFGEGGFLISPESIDVDGIDIRQKTLNGISPFVTTVVQSGHNTYQTFFRNNPRNLSEAGTWGSGGTFNIQHMYIRGNWNGSSGQTYVPPVSGNGNGITGLLKAEYDFDAQGGVIQLISSTRSFIRDVWVSHGYGHNIKCYRGGYGEIKDGRSFATRGSGAWILGPTASDAFTSTPITNMRFETCRGEYGGIYGTHMWGTSINNCLFEGQPYGIFMDESGDVDTSGSYMEGSYFEDFFTAAEVWGIVDIANYSFGQVDPRDVPERKGFVSYRRDSGLYVQTDTASFGTRPADINGFYMQRDSLGHGIMPAPLTGSGGVYQQLVKQLSGGGTTLSHYTSVKHTHNDTDDSGAAEVRFQRNLSHNSWGALSFATYDGATLADRWWVDKNGDFRPAIDNTVNIGTASERVVNIFAILPTYADEAAAASLSTGQMYKTATGEIRIKL